VRTCDVPPDAGPYLFWLGVISMAWQAILMESFALRRP